MQQYSKYKPSDVEWIGEIPDHWVIRRVSTFGKFFKGRGIKKDETKDVGLPCIRYGEIYTKYDRIVCNPTSFIDEETSKNSEIIKKGDVLFAGSGETVEDIGKAIVYFGNSDAYAGGDIIVLRLHGELEPIYASYLMNASFVQQQKSISAKGEIIVHIYPKNIREIIVPLPPIKEQTTITNFLDKKTTQIDKLISNKEKLIELLKEERIAIINDAVSGKGKKWEKVKFNHYIRLRHGFQFMNYDFTPAGIKIVKITQLSPNGYLDLSQVTYIDASRLDEFQDILINEGDILMALTGGTIGKIIRVGKVNEPLLQNYRVGSFFPANNKITKDFIFWVLSSEMILSQIFFEQRETGQPNIGKENFNAFKIALPSLNEQIQIVHYIKTETQRIDNTVSKIENEMEFMHEYREALISEVVTGKIKAI